MADNKPAALTRVYVSDDLSLLLWGKESITLSSLLYGAMEVKPAELPDLIARLTDAAESMGASTVQGELVKACKALLEAFEGYEMLAALSIDVQEMARAAIAKAE